MPEVDKNGVKIGDSFLEIIHRLKAERRWKNFDTPQGFFYSENVLGHSYEAALLASTAVSLEKALGRKEFDSERIILCAVVHDIGEGKTGDISFHMKNHLEAKKFIEEQEREAFLELIKNFPPEAQVVYIYAYDLQFDHESFEGRFFQALEYLGYIIYSWREYEHGREDFKAVFSEDFVRMLDELTRDLPGMASLFAPYKESIQNLQNSEKALK